MSIPQGWTIMLSQTIFPSIRDGKYNLRKTHVTKTTELGMLNDNRLSKFILVLIFVSSLSIFEMRT